MDKYDYERIEARKWVQDAITLYENAGKETLLREIAVSIRKQLSC